MRSTLFIVILFISYGYCQTSDSLSLKIKVFEECEKNFSRIHSDSTFCNFYIHEFKDTVYFRHSSCIIQAQTTTPTTFKRRTMNGYATGFLRIFMQDEFSYSWLDGNFAEGLIINGNYLEYYTNKELKLTGQFEKGHRTGVWTWYYENGRIKRIMVYDIAEPIKEIEYDSDGNIISEYDFFEEKAK